MRGEDLSYFEEEEFKESLRQYESALQEGRLVYMDADELTDIAEYYMVNGREPEALQCIEHARSLHPEASDPQVFLARQQMFHNNLDKAKKIASSIKQQDDREVQFLWTEIGIKEGYQKEASEKLWQYYDTLTEDKDYFLYDAANVFMDYDEWEIATQWAKRLQEDFPKFQRTNLLISDILVSCGKCVEAVIMLDDILCRDPFNMEAWHLMAEAESGQEHYNEALEAIEYLLAIDENNMQGQLIRANCLLHLGRMEEAHRQYAAYLDKIPDDISILYFDAVALTNLEQYDKARNLLERALEKSNDDTPELPHIYMQLSFVLSRMGDWKRAIENIVTAHEKGLHAGSSEYYLFRGHIYLENKKDEQAAHEFLLAMSHSTDKAITNMAIAIEYAECGHFHRALDIFQFLMDSDMPDKEALLLPYLAYCTYFIPEQPDHKTYLHKAAECNPALTLHLFAPIYPNVPVDQYKDL